MNEKKQNGRKRVHCSTLGLFSFLWSKLSAKSFQDFCSFALNIKSTGQVKSNAMQSDSNDIQKTLLILPRSS